MKKLLLLLTLLICLVLCTTFVLLQLPLSNQEISQPGESPSINLPDDSPHPTPSPPVKTPPDDNTDNTDVEDDNSPGDIAADNGPDNDNGENDVATDIQVVGDVDDIACKGAIIMTADGNVLFEKNADMQLRPASIGR